MSKSAREDRPWKYTGTFTLGTPVRAEDIQKQVVASCTCYACEANRRWLKQMKERQESHEMA